MKILSLISVLIFSVLSTESYGIAASIRPTMNGHTDEDCSNRTQNGGVGNLSEISNGLLHKAKWYQDRDNSMSDANDAVGDAMAVVYSANGFTQSIQVCPGVYLATAHGALDSPIKAKRDNRPLRNAIENANRIISYPMIPENMMTASNSLNQYVSPRLRDPSERNWTDPSSDYVFIKVDNPINPDDYVRPIRSSREDLVSASNRGDVDVHLYRPKTRYNKDSSGNPDFNQETWARGGNEVAPLYQSPQRVNQRCELNDLRDTILIDYDCPSEQAVSGSPSAIKIGDESFLTGIHFSGGDLLKDSFEDGEIGNAFIGSEHFCDDYESVCGQPCADLNDEINKAKSVSL